MAYLIVQLRPTDKAWGEADFPQLSERARGLSWEPQNAQVRELMRKNGYELHPAANLASLTKQDVDVWPVHVFYYVSIDKAGREKVSMTMTAPACLMEPQNTPEKNFEKK